MNDLVNKISEKCELLDQATRRLKKSGDALAEAERDYKILLRQEVLKMRDAGVAVGVINMTVYGIPEVARARFKRDTAEATYDANQEYINTLKLEIRILDSQVDREWSRA